MNDTNTPSALLALLAARGLIRDRDQAVTLPAASPWFVKVLQALSGWLASLFLLGTFGVALHALFDTPSALMLIGAGLIAVTYVLLKNQADTLFFEHVALSLSLAGQAMIAFALFRWISLHPFSHPLPWAALAGLELILLFGIPNYLHRLFSAVVLTLAVIEAASLVGGSAIVIPLVLLTTVWLWQSEYRHPRHLSLKQAAGYGLSLALFWVAGSGWDTAWWSIRPHSHSSVWLTHSTLTSLLNGAVMLYAAYTLPRVSGNTIRFSLMGLIFLAAIALLSTQMPGLSVALTLLIIGFVRGNRLLQGLSIAALLWSVGRFYYTLHTTLLIKSALLTGTGILLLVVYALFRRTSDPITQEGASHDA